METEYTPRVTDRLSWKPPTNQERRLMIRQWGDFRCQCDWRGQWVSNFVPLWNVLWWVTGLLLTSWVLWVSHKSKASSKHFNKTNKAILHDRRIRLEPSHKYSTPPEHRNLPVDWWIARTAALRRPSLSCLRRFALKPTSNHKGSRITNDLYPSTGVMAFYSWSLTLTTIPISSVGCLIWIPRARACRLDTWNCGDALQKGQDGVEFCLWALKKNYNIPVVTNTSTINRS